MSRPIEFMAWDKWKIEMWLPESLFKFARGLPSNWEECFELFQYTGLKDKNGEKIFEGHILKCDEMTKYVNRIVHYVGDGYSLFLLNNNEKNSKSVGDLYEDSITGFCEIIGHEKTHPELTDWRYYEQIKE